MSLKKPSAGKPSHAQEVRERLRKGIANGDWQQAMLAERADIDTAQLSRFLKRRDDRGLSSAKLEILERVLDGGSLVVPTASPLPPEHAKALAQKLHDGQLSLFAGAGLSHLAPHRTNKTRRLPLWSQLAERVAEACGHVEDAQTFPDPLDLFDYIIHDGGGRPRLEQVVRDALDDKSYVPSSAHIALRQLPWSAVLTTNYEGLLQQTLSEKPVICEDDYFRLREANPPKLFHLHGSLANPHTLTRDDYRSWADKHPRAITHLRGLLQRQTVLFVGYSLSDRHLDDLFALIRAWTHESEKVTYSWMWRPAQAHMELVRRRDRMDVVSFQTEEQYEAAFLQIFGEWQKLKAATVPSTPPQAVVDAYAYDRVQYARAVDLRFGIAVLSGLYLPSERHRPDDVRLSNVFVEPSLELQVWRQRDWDSVKDFDGVADVDRDIGDVVGVELSLAEARRRESAERPADSRKTVAEVLDLSRTTVLLGAPGGGKSSLLRDVLVRAAAAWRDAPTTQPFPVLVPLREWEHRARTSSRLLDHVREQVPKLGEIGSGAVEAFLKQPTLWLIDGIDEIRAPEERATFRREVRALAAERPQDRFVVTSRPSGYSPGQFDESWTVATISPLDERQTSTLLRKWQAELTSTERWPTAVEKIEDALRTQPGLRLLRGNPLLLTLIVLFFARNRVLPRDRYELYQYATDALSNSWLQHRALVPEAMPVQAIRSVLERLALDGMQRGTVLFSRRQVEIEAERVLVERGYARAEVDREIPQVVRAAQDLIGVLVEQGPDQFGFLHLTFQEFYAARALTTAPDVERQIARWWDHPDWREVWALYAIAISTEEAKIELLCATIRDNGFPAIDDTLLRPSLEIARLMGMGGEPVFARTAAWKKVEEAIRTSIGRSGYALHSFADIFQTWEKRLPASLSAALLARLTDEDEYVRSAAVQALSSQAQDSTVCEALLSRLADKNENVRSAVVQALSGQAQDGAVRDALLTRLADNNEEVRSGVVQALSDHVQDGAVRETLLSQLADENRTVRFFAVSSLSKQAQDGAVREALLSRLADKNASVRSAVAKALSWQVHDDAVRDALLARLMDNNEDVRSAVVQALSRQAQDGAVREALLAQLADKNEKVRSAASKALSDQTQDGALREALLARLVDNNKNVRSAASKALSGQTQDRAVREALLARLTDNNKNVRSAVVQVLSDQVQDGAVREALLTRLADENESVRVFAAGSLSSQAQDGAVREALLSGLADKNASVRSAVAKALSGQARDGAVREALLERLADNNEGVRSAVAKALSGQAKDGAVREALLARLADNNENVRAAVVQALSDQVQDGAVRKALLSRLADENGPVRFFLVNNLLGQVQDGTVREALLAQLKDRQPLFRQSEQNEYLRKIRGTLFRLISQLIWRFILQKLSEFARNARNP